MNFVSRSTGAVRDTSRLVRGGFSMQRESERVGRACSLPRHLGGLALHVVEVVQAKRPHCQPAPSTNVGRVCQNVTRDDVAHVRVPMRHQWTRSRFVLNCAACILIYNPGVRKCVQRIISASLGLGLERCGGRM